MNSLPYLNGFCIKKHFLLSHKCLFSKIINLCLWSLTHLLMGRVSLYLITFSYRMRHSKLIENIHFILETEKKWKLVTSFYCILQNNLKNFKIYMKGTLFLYGGIFMFIFPAPLTIPILPLYPLTDFCLCIPGTGSHRT